MSATAGVEPLITDWLKKIQLSEWQSSFREGAAAAPTFGAKEGRFWSHSHTQRLELTWQLTASGRVLGVGLDLESLDREILPRVWERFSPLESERVLLENPLWDWAMREACWKADLTAQAQFPVVSMVRVLEYSSQLGEGIAQWTSGHRVHFKLLVQGDHLFAFAVALSL